MKNIKTLTDQRHSMQRLQTRLRAHYVTQQAIRTKRLEDAISWMNYGVKEGFYDIEQFEGMTDDQLVEFHKTEQDRSDYAYESQREEQHGE